MKRHQFPNQKLCPEAPLLGPLDSLNPADTPPPSKARVINDHLITSRHYTSRLHGLGHSVTKPGNKQHVTQAEVIEYINEKELSIDKS